jgi:hypothetical protein
MLTFKKEAYLKKGGNNLRQLLQEVVGATKLDTLATNPDFNLDLAARRSAEAPKKVRITISVEEVKD